LVPNSLIPGNVLDTEKPLTPQFETTIKEPKSKLPSEQYNEQLNFINNGIYTVVGLCSEPSTRIGYCDGAVSLTVLMCKGDTIKRDAFACTNAQHIIDGYLKDYYIIDPETQARTLLENTFRGE
jgi:hypothetical protein